jgi:hypothetical protein
MRMNSNISALIPLFMMLLTVQGCTRWSEAWNQMGRGEFFIQFGCDQASGEIVENRTSRPSIPIGVQGAPEPGPMYIGDLFHMNGNKPVYITGTSPNNVLVEDIKSMLISNGYTVAQDAASAKVVLLADITELGAGGIYGKWTELFGRTVGQIEYTVTLTQSESVLWSDKFTAREEMKVAYFYVKDMETVLKRAYCNTLTPLESALASEEFQKALSGHADPQSPAVPTM